MESPIQMCSKSSTKAISTGLRPFWITTSRLQLLGSRLTLACRISRRSWERRGSWLPRRRTCSSASAKTTWLTTACSPSCCIRLGMKLPAQNSWKPISNVLLMILLWHLRDTTPSILAWSTSLTLNKPWENVRLWIWRYSRSTCCSAIPTVMRRPIWSMKNSLKLAWSTSTKTTASRLWLTTAGMSKLTIKACLLKLASMNTLQWPNLTRLSCSGLSSVMTATSMVTSNSLNTSNVWLRPLESVWMNKRSALWPFVLTWMEICWSTTKSSWSTMLPV